jgi:hypothetical protein
MRSSSPVRSSSPIVRLAAASVLVGCMFIVESTGSAAAAETATVPVTIDLNSAVRDHFAKQRDYRSGDLLTRGKVEAALPAIERKTGWKLENAEREALLKLTLDDKSFLAKQLTSKTGKDFARQIAGMPLGYDKLDRLSHLPQGESTIQRLVVGPDGYKLLEYMTSSRGGRELSRMLSADGEGDFEKPTGKIYDDRQLTSALRQLHKAALARQAGGTRTRTGAGSNGR